MTNNNFAEVVKQDTPRLVVMFRAQGDKEEYQWGIVGAIPLLTLIGCITRLQAEMASHTLEECPESALVVAWNPKHKSFAWFIHRDIPVDSMLGMLETIKMTLVTTNQARTVAAQKVQILGPDGLPVSRGGVS